MEETALSKGERDICHQIETFNRPDRLDSAAVFNIFWNYVLKLLRHNTMITRHYKMQRMSRKEEEVGLKELTYILNNTRTIYNPLPGYDKTVYQERYQIGLDCDEVYPNIYIGDASSAKNKQYLMKLGITHVVNTAEGKLFGMVDTDQEFYKNTTIKYLGFSIMDLPVSNISQHFFEVADFMEKAIKEGGKILVHCLMGISRSSTCVLAYLMIKEGMTAGEALRQVRQNRDIQPNDGFLLQLVQLENKLKRERNGIS